MDPTPLDEPNTLDPEPGVTRVLTEEGWEESLYLEPAEDWRLLDDGSWSSPDGQVRSWPLVGPQPPDPR
jgi:hypothetical protein